MKKQELEKRIIARGEFSNHSHIVVGDANVYEENGTTFIDAEQDVTIEHLLESAWMNGTKEWTKEHSPIPLEKGKYEVVLQIQYDPYQKAAERARD
jgi:hypothetical protein